MPSAMQRLSCIWLPFICLSCIWHQLAPLKLTCPLQPCLFLPVAGAATAQQCGAVAQLPEPANEAQGVLLYGGAGSGGLAQHISVQLKLGWGKKQIKGKEEGKGKGLDG